MSYKTALLGLLALMPAAIAAEDSDHIYQKALRGTALIAIRKEGRVIHHGTGWVVDAKKKLVVTNHHVVPNGGIAYVSFPKHDGGELVTARARYDPGLGVPARVLDSDPKLDLAVLRLEYIPEGVHALPLAEKAARPGQALHLVGTSDASADLWTYTAGKVRNRVKRAVHYRDQLVDTTILECQMDANTGDSGSAVVNNKGEVVGVHSGSNYDPKVKNLAFVIDVEVLKQFLGEADRLADGRGTSADLAERARRQGRKARWADAVADFTAALKKGPRSALLYRERGDAHFRLGQYDAQIADAAKALEMDPEDGHAANLRGMGRHMKGDLAKAAADYTRAIALRPDEPAFHRNRGLAHSGLARWEDAAADFGEAIRLDPRYTDAYLNRAEAHTRLKRHGEAAVDLLAAVKLRPGDPGLLARLGEALAADGRHEGALDAYLKALDARHPRPGQVWRLAGASFSALDEHAKAAGAYSLAIKADPKDAAAWFGLGAAREDVGDVEGAQEAYDRATGLDPALGKRLSTFATRSLVIRNDTGRKLTLTVAYEARTEKGAWKTFTATWEFEPGQESWLKHDGWKVHARSFQVRVDGEAGPLVKAAEKPYRARRVAAFVYRVGR